MQENAWRLETMCIVLGPQTSKQIRGGWDCGSCLYIQFPSNTILVIVCIRNSQETLRAHITFAGMMGAYSLMM